MKIKGIPSLAVSCALCGVAVAASSMISLAADLQPTTPTRPATEPPFTAAEQGYVNQMQGVIASSKAKGSLDSRSMNNVFASAFRANVKPQVHGKMVSDLVKAYPESVSQISTSALAPANGVPTKEHIWHVMNNAVMSSPRPFSTVLSVRDAAMRSIDHSKVQGLDDYVKYATVRIASATPDNPMNRPAYNFDQIGTEREQQGLAIKALRTGQAGHGVLFHDADVGIDSFFTVPQPVSPQGGAEAR